VEIIKTQVSEALPIPLEDLKLDLRVDSSDEDDTISRMARAAGAFLEIRTGWSVIPGTYQVLLCEFPCGPLEIYRSPLRDLESIEYLSAADTWDTVDLADFQISRRRKSFVIAPLSTFVAPTLFTDLDSVRITFTAGFDAEDSSFGDGTQPIDDGVRTLMTMLVAHWYQNRELFLADKGAQIEEKAGSMLGAYRTFW